MVSATTGPKSTRWAAHSAASRARRNGESRSIILPSMEPSRDDTTTANGLNGTQLANFAPGAILGEIDRTTTHSTTAGLSLQATNSDQLFGHDNRFTIGAAFDSSVTRFGASPELGTIGRDYVV